MTWTDLFPPLQTWIGWAIQAALAYGLISVLAGLLITLLNKIPFIGAVLGNIVRVLASNYERWLAERLPKIAEQAVLAIEERYRKRGDMPPEERASEKLQAALDLVNQMAPGIPPSVARASVDAALTTMRHSYQEQKARMNS